MRLRLSPETRAKFLRFRSSRRGFLSLLALLVLVAISLVAELLVNNRALAVKYAGTWYFPTYGAILTGRQFGFDYDYEVDYAALADRFREAGGDDRVILPLIPYGPYQNCYPGQVFQARPPDWAKRHFLGTDQLNRDVLARLLYGFRTALIFAALYVTLTYAVGVALGGAMAFLGGWFDILGQRLIEVWSLIPFLFVVIIVRASIPPDPRTDLWILLGLVVLFSWISITYFMRSATYKEKAREYVAAVQVLGAGPVRILFRHIVPNTLATLVTFVPFTVAAAISSLTALDFLGFGLPPPTPSWGELLRQGTGNLSAPWIVASAFAALCTTLNLVTFVGEAVREAFDPKRFTLYR